MEPRTTERKRLAGKSFFIEEGWNSCVMAEDNAKVFDGIYKCPQVGIAATQI